LGAVRIGYYTLQELYEKLRLARNESSIAPQSVQNLLPEVFSFFDCTDYFDSTDGSSQPRGFLTFALRKKQHDTKIRMSWWDHVRLLWAYVVRQQPNVHGGYFDGNLCRQIIYRLACLGFKDTVDAYRGLDSFSDACKSKQIRVLLSPRLPTEKPSPQTASTAR
jgi:hypothetical protein